MLSGPVVIIVNPVSGRRKALRKAEKVARELTRRGVCVEVKQTQRKLHAAELTTQACNHGAEVPQCVVACGGDGTIQEVAQALLELKDSLGERRPALALAPAGRCNDLARFLQSPRDVPGIVETIVSGGRMPIDLGQVNGRCFCTVATLGIDAEVSSFVDDMRMPLRGTPAYIYGALRVLARYKAPLVRIEGDFGVIEKRVFLASSANTASYGGAIPIAPGASPADGILDLCIIDKVSIPRALWLIPIVMAGRHLRQPEVSLLRSRRLRVETEARCEIWADGERIATTPAEIEIVPNAVEVIVSKALRQ